MNNKICLLTIAILSFLVQCSNESIVDYYEIDPSKIDHNTINGWVRVLNVSKTKEKCTTKTYASKYLVLTQQKDTIQVICPCIDYWFNIGDQVLYYSIKKPKKLVYAPKTSFNYLTSKTVFGQLTIPDD